MATTTLIASKSHEQRDCPRSQLQQRDRLDVHMPHPDNSKSGEQISDHYQASRTLFCYVNT